MLGFYFFITIVASYSLCVSGNQHFDPCLFQHLIVCNIEAFPEEFPKTVDELRNVCRDLKLLSGCLLAAQENCSDDRILTNRSREKFNYIDGVCNEDSEIFQIISSNIECIASASGNAVNRCDTFDFRDPTKELIMKAMQEFVMKREMSNDENQCIDILWRLHCPSTIVGAKCRHEAGIAVKDVLYNIIRYDYCSDDLVAEVTPVMGIIEFAILQEELLKKFEEEEQESPAEETPS